MLILGIAGGVASGKTEIAKLFEKLGAHRIDADQIGHQVLCDPQTIESLVSRWGPKIQKNGTLDRKAIGAIVFTGTEQAAIELEFLESITHPKIQYQIERQIEESKRLRKDAVILDAALLFKTGWDQICDYIVFADVPQQIRQQRAEKRGWTKADFEQREKAQIAVHEKRQRSHFILDNSQPLPIVQKQVHAIWAKLTEHTLSKTNPN